jgi:hypothetical protein
MCSEKVLYYPKGFEVTRAFGLADYKEKLDSTIDVTTKFNENYLISRPDIWVYTLTHKEDFII